LIAQPAPPGQEGPCLIPFARSKSRDAVESPNVFRIVVPLILFLQGIPVQQGGKVTGVLRDDMGIPLEGVRIGAVARGAAIEEAAEGAAMAGLAQTDEQGRFTLENIPPGRYSIAAGRLDLQTYYPGTQSLADATILTITAGETISGINFVLNNTSFGRSPGSGTVRITASIPVRVTMDKGGKVPISAEGKLISLRLESTSGVLDIPIDGVSFVVPGPVATDFRLSVQDLPDTYEVKSIAYGATAIPQGIFRLSAANFPTVAAAPAPVTVTLPSSTGAPATETELRAFLDALSRGAAAAPLQTTQSTSVIVYSGNPLKPATTPPSTLSITLGEVAKPPSGGVRVSGNTTATRDRRRVYISGKPGVVFTDGSFEFRDVPPGRHLIASTGNGRPMAAVLVVGDKNVDGVELKETLLLPDDARVPKDPRPAGDVAPGTTVPLARITGTVIEELSKTPITEGEIQVRSGDASRTVSIDSTGRFEFSALLPGTYDLRLQIFGHTTVGPTVVVEDKNIDLEVTSRRLY
jgi:hypothetical protein